MDKYEYKLKTEQMLELMESGAYSKAAEIADTIDWKRVRNTTMLMNVSDIYEKIGDNQKSYEVLNIAYHRAEGGRKVIYRLCALALKTGNVDEAIDYYDDFVQAAPKDPNQHILRYKILRARRSPAEQQIEALEEFKKAEYIEEWAYELAKLYQEAGMTAECLEECDDLILWFSEGKYVYKAMELKMQYKQLTPSQQEKYDHRFEKIDSSTAEIEDIVAYAAKDSSTVEESAPEESTVEESIPEENAIEDSELEETAQIDTVLVNEAFEEEEPILRAARIIAEESYDDPEPFQPFKQVDIDDSFEEVSEFETASLEVSESGDASQDSEVLESEEDNSTVLEAVEEELEEELEEPEEELPEEVDETIQRLEEKGIGSRMKLGDALKSLLGPKEEEENPELEEAIEQIESVADLGLASNLVSQAVIERFDPDLEELKVEPEDQQEDELDNLEQDDEALDNSEVDNSELENIDAEPISQECSIEESKQADNDQIEGQMSMHDLLSDSEEQVLEEEDNMGQETKKTESILPPDIQRLIDEIEGNIPADTVIEEEQKEPITIVEDVYDHDEQATKQFSADDVSEILASAAVVEAVKMSEEFEEEDWDDFEEEDLLIEEDLLEEEEDFDEDLFDDGEEFEEEFEEEFFDDGEDFDADLFGEEDKLELEEAIQPSVLEVPELDDREIPDEEDEIDLLSATTPLSRKETAKMIATGKTAPLPVDEISDALSLSNTGFIVHGRYDLETQSGIGTRAGLTEEQKKLFSYFVPVRGMSEQLVDVLAQDQNCNNRENTSRTGNLLIIGNKGNGKTVLAVDVVKAIQKQRNIRQGKVAIVTGDSLNKKKISEIFEKLYGGALIIEKAGRLNEKTVARLNKAMERETGELLVVLEEQRKPLDRLLSSNREFRRKFTSRLEVPIFINDELVTFGQTYAQENGYRIDEMGILALYSRIDALQREDHSVTVAEVKEVMDVAMEHSQRASAKKLVKRVFGKNTDDSDRIILSEKDFN